MKLSKGLIAGILEKERKTNPKVHYISDITKANDFAEVVRIFNGRSIMAYGIEEIHEITAASNSSVFMKGSAHTKRVCADFLMLCFNYASSF